MWPSVQVFVIVALACPLSSAAECDSSAGLCSRTDETSLLQVNRIVKLGSERSDAEMLPAVESPAVQPAGAKEATEVLPGTEKDATNAGAMLAAVNSKQTTVEKATVENTAQGRSAGADIYVDDGMRRRRFRFHREARQRRYRTFQSRRYRDDEDDDDEDDRYDNHEGNGGYNRYDDYGRYRSYNQYNPPQYPQGQYPQGQYESQVQYQYGNGYNNYNDYPQGSFGRMGTYYPSYSGLHPGIGFSVPGAFPQGYLPSPNGLPQSCYTMCNGNMRRALCQLLCRRVMPIGVNRLPVYAALEEQAVVDKAPAGKAAPNQPIVTWKAETESMPDHLDKGSVTQAYNANLEKEKGAIVSKAASSLRFGKEVERTRRANREAAQRRVAALGPAVKKAIVADEAAVREVIAKKRAVEKAAEEEVEHAKEDWEAHHIKKEQAERYAIEGRLEGARQGEEEAERQLRDAEEAAERDAAARRRAEEMEVEAKRLAEQRAAINRVTEEERKSEEANTRRAEAAAKDIEVHVAAVASRAEEAVEGAEGMKNRIIAQSALRDSDEYRRKTTKDQKRINEARAAKWPQGDWPDP